jgi:arsenate reductase (glutaredoxin)
MVFGAFIKQSLTCVKYFMMAHCTVYGIKNCDTVKKATDWLKKNKIDFEFHDYKTQGISTDKLKDWCNQTGWEKLVNKKGSTFRQLDEETKSKITNETAAISLMTEKTSVIKRPVIEKNGKFLVLGFDPKEYEKLL